MEFRQLLEERRRARNKKRERTRHCERSLVQWGTGLGGNSKRADDGLAFALSHMDGIVAAVAAAAAAAAATGLRESEREKKGNATDGQHKDGWPGEDSWLILAAFRGSLVRVRRDITPTRRRSSSSRKSRRHRDSQRAISDFSGARAALTNHRIVGESR